MHLLIHLSAQSAFFLTQGMVSTARKRWSFSTGSLMYVSSKRLYISVGQAGTARSAPSQWVGGACERVRSGEGGKREGWGLPVDYI